MKRGLIRSGPDLPTQAEQRASISHFHPDAMLFELDGTPEGFRVLESLLNALRAGDVLVLHGLEIFNGTSGEVARMVRNLLEIGVELRITGGEWRDLAIPADEALIAVLTMLADREHGGLSRILPYNRGRMGGARKRALSVFQMEYARKLYDEGVSLRQIGMIFQATPNEVWAAIAKMPKSRKGVFTPPVPPPPDLDDDPDA